MDRVAFEIREAKAEDISSILSLLSQKFKFDGGIGELPATPDLLQQTLFGTSPKAYVLLAEVADVAVGLALFYFSYSSVLAQPCLWLDDLFIQSHMRRQGIGTAFFNRLAQIARSHHCGRIEWTVNAKNANGIDFYQQQGAKILDGIQVCRLDRVGIDRLYSDSI
jgi:GNAT superfamily N-acetyltransferase